MSKKNVMNQVILALNSGLSNKALSLLKKFDKHLSIKNANHLVKISIQLDEPDIFMWLTMNSINRHDLIKVNMKEIFRDACEHGRINTVKALISNVSMEYHLLGESLRVASYEEHTEIIKTIISKGTNYLNKEHLEYSLYNATFRKNIDIVKILIFDVGVNSFANSNGLLLSASESGHDEILKILLAQKNPSLIADGPTLLLLACINGRINTIKILLSDDRINLTANIEQLLKSAKNLGQIDIIKILSENLSKTQ